MQSKVEKQKQAVHSDLAEQSTPVEKSFQMSWWDTGTSQSMFDPFSLVHCTAGFLSRWLTEWDPVTLTQMHQLWEMFENSPWGVHLLEPSKFRKVMPCLRHMNLAWDEYHGDSSINSAADTCMFLAGVQLANKKLHPCWK